MKYWNWLLIILIIGAGAAINFLFPSIPLIYKLLNVLLFSLIILVIRAGIGPSAADRLVAFNIFGMVIIGICALIAVKANSPNFLDIALAWALQCFVGTIALAKLLEGRPLDD